MFSRPFLINREGNNVDNKGVSTLQKEMPYKVAVVKQEDILYLACQGHHCKQDKGQILAKRVS